MSYAPDYTPGTSFADDETNNVAGRSLVKTDRLDSELADISASINALNDNQKAFQRDDGKLADSLVEPYALAEQTKALIATSGSNPRGTWQTNTDYAYKDVIQRNNIAQMCLQAHNSGSTFTQSFWLQISGDGTSAANAAAAAASASSASASQVAAASSASAAASSASSASTSATNAASSATNASNSSSSASTSASNAASSASESQASADAAAASAASINAPKNATNDPTFASTSSTDPVSPEWFHGGVKVDFNADGNAPLFACRAWVNFNGSGTPSIRSSGNVSSITDNGTGDYTINFITAMQDANYAVDGVMQGNSVTVTGSVQIHYSTAPLNSSVRVFVSQAAATSQLAIDSPYICVKIHR